MPGPSPASPIAAQGQPWHPATDLQAAEAPWYVVHTCSHHERRVEERLRQMGLEVFLPRLTVVSRRRDRKKTLQVPLFPGYLFVHEALETGSAYYMPQGVYYVLADISRIPGENSKAKAMHLLRQTGVTCVPGEAFYHDDAGETWRDSALPKKMRS